MNNELKTGWVKWQDIEPYQDQIIELLYETTTKYHYPDWNISKDFSRARVVKLEQFLESEGAYVWCAFDGDTIACIYWGYIIPFINKKRWHYASFIVHENYRGQGLGRMAVKKAEEKARELDCDDMALMHVPWNKGAEKLYIEEGYEITRIERVKKLK